MSASRYAAARVRAELRRVPPGEWVKRSMVGPMGERPVINLGLNVLIERGEVEEEDFTPGARVRLVPPPEPAPAQQLQIGE